MELFDIATILIVVTAIFGYINYRYIKLPTTIGMMIVSLVISFALVFLGWVGFDFVQHAEHFLEQIDFEKALMHGMLGFLLFAGALHINLNDLSGQKWAIGLLATIGMLASAFFVGGVSWWVFGLLGLNIGFIHCLVFGALISPTDPVAVLGIVKKAGAPKSLETKISGEALFNDGFAVVVFIILMKLASGGHEIVPSDIIMLFMAEAVGGVIFGLLLGLVTYRMLKNVDDYQVEVLITLAAVMGGSVLAEHLNTSGPIAMVVTGLFIGNHGRAFAMSDTTRQNLDTFWDLIDGILNAVLFVLIGMEVLAMKFNVEHLIAGLVMILVVLIARWLSVGGVITLLRTVRTFTPGAVRIITWAGLRGGISVAMALSLPHGPERNTILAATYTVVVFSILVQGLTLGSVVRKTLSGKT